jgi:hypothetical protein
LRIYGPNSGKPEFGAPGEARAAPEKGATIALRERGRPLSPTELGFSRVPHQYRASRTSPTASEKVLPPAAHRDDAALVTAAAKV